MPSMLPRRMLTDEEDFSQNHYFSGLMVDWDELLDDTDAEIIRYLEDGGEGYQTWLEGSGIATLAEPPRRERERKVNVPRGQIFATCLEAAGEKDLGWLLPSPIQEEQPLRWSPRLFLTKEKALEIYGDEVCGETFGMNHNPIGNTIGIEGVLLPASPYNSVDEPMKCKTCGETVEL